jgi:hypothetical protein
MMLMSNGEAVAEDGKVGGTGGMSQQSERDGTEEQRGNSRRNSRRRQWFPANHLLRLIFPLIIMLTITG